MDDKEVINGWTISLRDGNWIMVKNGIIGYQHKVKSYVVARARITK